MIYYIGQGEYEKIEKATIQDCYEYLKEQKEIGIDIETSRKYPKNQYREDIYKPGLDPYLSRVVMLQLGTEERVYVIDTRTEDISILIPLFESKDILWVGSNLKFEAKHLKHNYKVNFSNIWDVMLVDINLTNGLGWSKTNHKGFRYSVLAMSERYLGIKNQAEVDLFNQMEEEDAYIDKSTRMQFVDIGDKLFTKNQIEYGADDIIYPLQIKKLQEKGRSGYNPTKLHKLENDFCLVLADIELKGITFSPEQWLKVYEEKKIVYQKRLDKLNTHIIKNFPKFCTTPDLFDPTPKCKIMWSSSDQVIELFKSLGVCPKEKSKQTKKLEFTVGAKALSKLLTSAYKEFYMDDKETDIISTEDLVLNYLLLKKSEQAITTFGEDWLKHIHPITKRIHTSFVQILNTGRISSQNPNVQNIPSEKEYRMAFVATTGYKIVNCDYASQESRVLAEVCGDKDMLAFFNEGHPIFKDDYHSFTATKMFRIIRNEPDLLVSKKTHPKERQDAKAIGFKIAYGGSAYTLKDDFGVDETVAQEFIDGYFEAFPSLKADFDKAQADVLKKGYILIDNIIERKWFDPSFELMNSLTEKAWSYFPKNYRDLSKDKKEEVKKEIYKKNPEVKELWSKFFSLQGKLMRNALNYRIQGVAGSQLKKAGVLFREYQLDNHLEDKIYLTSLIHDEAISETANDFQEEGRKIIEEKMIEGAQFFCTKVKMDASAVLTDFWFH